MQQPFRALAYVSLLSLGALVACATSGKNGTQGPPPPPPLKIEGSAYEAAAVVRLPDAKAAEGPGLHNVYHLSPNVISGSEPHGEEALAELARMGVKTVLSVDGQAPDHQTAAKYGLRYVHIPIQYKGITQEEMLKIAKTFREAEGPFYVHCFHGKHRGPAAAAIGRILLDGAPREVAAAEMRQWCGTGAEYDGLYRAVLTQELPDADATARLDYDMPPQVPFGGLREAMVQVSRAHDHVQDLLKLPEMVDPEHPDLDVVNEATKMLQALEGSLQSEECAQGPADLRQWMTDSVERSRQLVATLRSVKAGEVSARAAAEAEFKSVRNLCSQCHRKYRN